MNTKHFKFIPFCLSLVITLVISSFTFADDSIGEKFYKKAIESYQAKNYQQSYQNFKNALAKKNLLPENLKPKATLLMAVSLFRLKSYSGAIKVLNSLLDNQWKTIHLSLLKDYQQNSMSQEPNNEMLMTYFYLAQSHWQLSANQNERNKEESYKLIKFYLFVCENMDFQSENVSKMNLKINQYFEDKEKNKYDFDFYFPFGLYWWQERINLNSKLSPELSESLLSSSSAFGLGLGLLLSNQYWGISGEVSLILGSSEIKEALDATVAYEQRGIATNGGIFKTGIWKIYGDQNNDNKSRLGLNFISMLSNTNYTVPANYTIKDSPFKIGFSIESIIILSSYNSLSIEFAHLNSSNLLSLKILF